MKDYKIDNCSINNKFSYSFEDEEDDEELDLYDYEFN